MNDRLLDYAIRIQSIAQAGLQYGRTNMTGSGTLSCGKWPRR